MSRTRADGDGGEVLRDLVTGGLCLGLTVILATAHFRQPGRLHTSFGPDPGPALLPEILLGALGMTAVALLMRGFATGGRGARVPLRDEVSPAKVPAFALAALGLLVAFLVMLPVIGFIPAALVLGAIVCGILARQESRPIARAAIEGAVVAAILCALFLFALSVPLP